MREVGDSPVSSDGEADNDPHSRFIGRPPPRWRAGARDG